MKRLRDSFGRTFTCLRLSLTEACGLRCLYCNPLENVRVRCRETVLSRSEIRRLLEAFVGLGVSRVRFTGGEPTLCPELVAIVEDAVSVDGLESVAITTNGIRLRQLGSSLRDAGVAAVNISLDSLNRKRFREITGQDWLREVLQGVDCAISLGFPAVKTNTVLLRGINDGEIEDFLAFAKERPLSLRFIELMKTGANEAFFKRHYFSAAGLREKLLADGWKELKKAKTSGPAREYSHPQSLGTVGIIAPYEEHFCKSCNRLRVDSAGRLHLCLFGKSRCGLKPFLQSDSQREDLQERILSFVKNKPEAHLLHDGDSGDTDSLVAIGG